MFACSWLVNLIIGSLGSLHLFSLPRFNYSRQYLNYSFHRGVTHGCCLSELSRTPLPFLLSARLWCICLALFLGVGNSHLRVLRGAECILLISRLILSRFNIASGLCCARTLYLHGWWGVSSSSLATFNYLDLRLAIICINILNWRLYFFSNFKFLRALAHLF